MNLISEVQTRRPDHFLVGVCYFCGNVFEAVLLSFKKMPENKQWLRKLAIVFGVLIGGIVLACAALNFVLGGPCGYEELKRVSSPDKRFDAVLVEVNCGATADYAYWVSVVPHGSKDYRKSVFVANRLDANEFEFDWTGDRLTIGLPAQYQEFKRHTHASLGWGKLVELTYVER